MDQFRTQTCAVFCLNAVFCVNTVWLYCMKQFFIVLLFLPTNFLQIFLSSARIKHPPSERQQTLHPPKQTHMNTDKFSVYWTWTQLWEISIGGVWLGSLFHRAAPKWLKAPSPSWSHSRYNHLLMTWEVWLDCSQSVRQKCTGEPNYVFASLIYLLVYVFSCFICLSYIVHICSLITWS